MYGTLTYDERHVPKDGSLSKRDHQLFLKKLRQRLLPVRVRYYLAGEYGEENGRPHYHFLLFGFRPRDLVRVVAGTPFPLFDSPMIRDIWEQGMVRVGEVTIQSAMYVAGYVMKKVDQVGRRRKWSCDPETGEMHAIEPEYSAMSRGGRTGDGVNLRGLGHGWYEKYGAEVARLGSVVNSGVESVPPRYYDELLRERDEAAYEVMKLRRARKNRKWGPDQRPVEVMNEEKREAMAREVIARKRLDEVYRRL